MLSNIIFYSHGCNEYHDIRTPLAPSKHTDALVSEEDNRPQQIKNRLEM